jgi:predicted ATP-dependent Lon-type protease
MKDEHGPDSLLNTHFAGRVVRKDLTKLVKEGANVPVYVLEYLLGQHCASNDEAIIEDGLKTVKRSWPRTTSAPTKRRRSNRSSGSGAT